MKKFKEFEVKTHSVKQLSKALVNHAQMLGYKFDCDWGDYNFIRLRSDGHYYLSSCEDIEEFMSLDEFFKLTPEDVIVEPERYSCRFSFHSNVSEDHFLTQDQIERIKDIMNEVNHERLRRPRATRWL